MDELYMEWMLAVESGDTNESFEDWYSHIVNAAHEYAEGMER